MMMSPSSMRSASFSTVSPVYPAGTMTQAARGLSSLETNSSRLPDPVAPSPASAETTSALTS